MSNSYSLTDQNDLDLIRESLNAYLDPDDLEGHYNKDIYLLLDKLPISLI